MMETIYVSDDSTPFSLARWLLLKKKINQKEFAELIKLSKKELITKINDYGYQVKVRGRKYTNYDPSGSELFD